MGRKLSPEEWKARVKRANELYETKRQKCRERQTKHEEWDRLAQELALQFMDKEAKV